jgi:hypothetical protein
MPCNARCWKRQAVALAAAMILLNGCARVGSDVPRSACPAVVEYSQAEQSQLAQELSALSNRSLIIGWLSDYAVLRDQARVCARR